MGAMLLLHRVLNVRAHTSRIQNIGDCGMSFQKTRTRETVVGGVGDKRNDATLRDVSVKYGWKSGVRL